MDLKNKVALTAGGTGGIGMASAIQMSKMGASIILLARNEAKLKDTLSKLDSSQGQSHSYLVADFSVTCWEGSHASVFAAVLIPAMLLLVLGVPIGITLFLYKNKKILANDTDVSLKFQDTYGAAYMAYEPKFCKCCCCCCEVFCCCCLW